MCCYLNVQFQGQRVNKCSWRCSFLTSLESRVMGSNCTINRFFFYVDPESDQRVVSKTRFPEYLLIYIHPCYIVPTFLSENNWEIIFLWKTENDLNNFLNNIIDPYYIFLFIVHINIRGTYTYIYIYIYI